MCTQPLRYTPSRRLAVGFSYYPGRHNMGGRRGEFISRNHGGLAGVVSSLEGKSSLRKTTSGCDPLGPSGHVYTYIYIFFFLPRVSNFSFPSTLARMPPDFAVSFQQLDKSCRLLRVIPKKISPRNRRKNVYIYTRDERTLLPVLSSPTEKNNGEVFERWKGCIAATLSLAFSLMEKRIRVD